MATTWLLGVCGSRVGDHKHCFAVPEPTGGPEALGGFNADKEDGTTWQVDEAGVQDAAWKSSRTLNRI